MRRGERTNASGNGPSVSLCPFVSFVLLSSVFCHVFEEAHAMQAQIGNIQSLRPSSFSVHFVPYVAIPETFA